MQSQAITLAVALFVGLTGFTSAASTVFDDFSSGGYPAGEGTHSVAISTPFADNRLAYGNQTSWSATVDVVAGTFTYTSNLRGDPGPGEWFAMIYTSSLGNMNLSGYDAFVIHVESLSGNGQILAHLGSGAPSSSAIPVVLNGAGDLVIPFANLGAPDPSRPGAISFEIIPETRDFSITLSGISVIPEPSAVALSGFGLAMLLVRRQRTKPDSKK